MHSQVVGIIEMEPEANAAALTPRTIPCSAFSTSRGSSTRCSNAADREATRAPNGVLWVEADTDRLTRQLREEYRQLLLQWMDESSHLRPQD